MERDGSPARGESLGEVETGWGLSWEELRSHGRTRAELAKRLRWKAAGPWRWRALCWEERAVELTGNAPDQVPDQ